MTLADKLKTFLSENGTQIKWFAEKVGMQKQFFYNILHKGKSIPTKYWFPIIRQTKGEITLADFIQETLNDEVFKIRTCNGTSGECIVGENITTLPEVQK